MSNHINVRINDEISKKMKCSGLSMSEYTRKALNFYDVRKDNSLLQYKINTIQECIDLLVVERDKLKKQMIKEAYENLYKNNENVQINEDKNVYKNEEIVHKMYEDEENSVQKSVQNEDLLLYENEKNVQTMRKDLRYKQMEKYLPLLSKLINIHNIVPETTKEKIKNETTLTPKEINDFIVIYREEIKTFEYNISSERVHLKDTGVVRKK